MDPIRSLLFVPGNRPNFLEGARNYDVDALVPDLEDSVPPAEKANARKNVANILPTLAGRGRKLIPRINGLDTGLVYDDLRAVVGPHTWGIVAVKITSPADIRTLDGIIGQLESAAHVAHGKVRIITILESAKAILRAVDILTASPRVAAAALGAEDFTVDMGIQRSEDGAEIAVPRSMVAMAARAAGVWSLDTPYVNFRNADGLRKDIAAAKVAGMRGKFGIHQSQLDIINESFMPSQAEIDYAQRVVVAYADAKSKGLAAFSMDGKMVDIPVVKRAENLLAFAESVTRRGKVTP